MILLMEEAVARASASTWVEKRAEIGDLILIGSRDPVSRVIQRASNSRFSHAAVVTAQNEVTEAYDYSLTLNEDDEGIYRTSIDALLTRTPKLHRIMILRPTGLDRDRLRKAAAELHHNAPPYPTLGATMLGFIRLLSEPIPLLEDGLFKQHKIGKRLHRGLDRLAEIQVRFVGDGVRKLHCAESAITLYEEAGIAVELTDPFLRNSMRRADLLDDGSAAGAVAPSTARNRETRSSRKVLMRALLRPHRVAEAVIRVYRSRLQHMEVGAPGDYTFPADLENARPFVAICEMRVVDHPRRPWRRLRAAT